MRHATFLLLAGLAAPVAAQSPAAAPVCTGAPAPLPRELAAFRSATPLAAGTGKGGTTATLAPGQAAALTLHPEAALAYPVAPSHTGMAGTYGGVATLRIADGGTYRFALGAGAWLEVAQGGTALRSIAHDHGPACSGVRKLVDFSLTPGRYTVELVGNREPEITVLAVRLP